MHRLIRLVAPALLSAVVLCGLPGCVTTEGGEYADAREPRDPVGPLLRKQINQRIEALKFQRGVALLDSLNWLIMYGESAVPQLKEALEDPDPRTRSYVAYVLGEIGSRGAIPKLRDRLDREDHKLARYELAAALVSLGDWGQIGILIDGLEEPGRRYRYKCFEVLNKNLNLTFGYDPMGPVEERSRAIAKWRAWWKRNQESFTPVIE